MQEFKALPSRWIASWTPDDVLRAIAQASAGSLAKAADLWASIAADDHVRGVLSARTLGLLGLPLSWECDEPPDWYALAPEAELDALLTWGLGLGVGFAHIEPDGSLVTWNARWFDRDYLTGQWYVTTSTGRYALDSTWIVFTPYGSSEPWYLGLWLSLAIPWLAKQFAIHDRARASEVFGSAMIVGHAPEGATDGQRKKWLLDLETLSRSSRIVLPEGYSLELLEAQGQTWGIYKDTIEWADDALTIAIAGQTVTTNGTAGFSSGDVHDRIARSLLRFTAEAFSTFLGRCYVPRVYGYCAYPRWAIDPPADIAAFADILAKLGAGITAFEAASKRRVDVDALSGKFDIPLLEMPSADLTGLDESSPDYAADLAERMTQHAIERCEHGSLNRCRMCGIERHRDPIVAPDGSVTWRIAWRAIVQPVAPKTLSAAVASRLLTMSADAATGSIRSIGIPITEPRKEFRIFKVGRNETDHGAIFYTTIVGRKLVKALGSRELMIDLEHLSLKPDSPNYDPDARGWARLTVRRDGLYATSVRWTADGTKRIKDKTQRFISPAFFTDSKGVVTRMLNAALTALPAMHDQEALIAASAAESTKRMDPELLEMLGLAADATPEAVMAALTALLDAVKAALGLPSEATLADIMAALGGASGDGTDTGGGTPAPADTATPQAANVLGGLAKALAATNKRLDEQERERLMSSRPLKPFEKKFLATQSIESIKLYLASVPAQSEPVAPTRPAPDVDTEMNAARAAVRRAMGVKEIAK